MGKFKRHKIHPDQREFFPRRRISDECADRGKAAIKSIREKYFPKEK